MTANTHIREFLSYYCALPTEPQYAVLLTGLWGSGKTWFIKDFTATHLPQPDRVLYLSLYGVQSFDDIESELFRLLHPLLGSKPARILGRLACGVLKTSLNFDLDGDGKADGNVSGGIPAEKLLERVSLDSNRILIFDDLERCSIPIADVLGYVNQFVEHGGVKAILIANEAELRSGGDGAGPGYARIKEKLIGRTFEVVPEVTSALEHFANDLPTPEAQAVVRANFGLITQVYECSGYKNLRLVRHALWDFDRLLQTIEPNARRSDSLLADLLALFLSYSLEVKSGAVKPSEISKVRDSWALYFRQERGEPDPDQHFHDIRKKYSGLNLYNSLIQDAVWESIFTTGSIPTADLNEALLKSKYFQHENQPTWVKLWYGMNLSDTDFSAVLTQVETEWDSRAYRELGEVVHVAGQFVRLAKNGILKRSVTDVIASAKEYIEHLIESGAIPTRLPNSRPHIFERDAYAGLGFASTDDEQFQEFLKYIDERREAELKSSFPDQAAELLDLVGRDSNLFLRRIILNNDPDNVYYKTPILHLIQPADFVAQLLTAAPEERKVVAYAFKERYSFHEFNRELLPELAWLREVADLLRAEIAARAGRISSLSLKWILDPYITHAVTQLEKAGAPAPT